MKTVIAGLIFLQHVFFIAAPAAVTASTVLLAGCSTHSERADTRQKTRIENRTDDRYGRRRAGD